MVRAALCWSEEFIEDLEKTEPAMEICNGPVAAMSIGEALRCLWEKGSAALTGVIQSPGSATITDWALALFAVLIAINVISLILRILLPPFRYR